MKISNEGLQLIISYEGLRLTAYRCPAGKLTIGYGHTGPDVYEGKTISEKEAKQLLREDLKAAEKAVNSYRRNYYPRMNKNQFSALVSFTYNCAAGNLDQLCQRGARSLGEIATKIQLYNKAGGKVLQGLVNRREAEWRMFIS